MFKLVVLSVLVAVVAAKPGYLHGAQIIAAPAAIAAYPSAISHSSRTDIVSNPIVATSYATAPVLSAAIHAAPAVYSHTAYAAAPAAVIAHSPVVIGHGHLGYHL